MVSWLVVCGVAYGQIYSPEREVRISDLPGLTAASKNGSDVLAASLEIILRDAGVCCGRNSALGDRVQLADPKSLRDIADKLRGKHVMSDGRTVTVTADFVPAAAVNVGQLIGMILAKRATLMEWNAHLYVVYGVTYDEGVDENGAILDSILKILLVDTKFSDERRELLFNRASDDWGKVQGILTVKAEREQ
jgi:hypothetical protein